MLKKIFFRISPVWYVVDALLILAAVLIIQYVFDYPPCPLCVGQRFPWVLLIVLVVIAARAEYVSAYGIRTLMLGLAALTMIGSAGFGIYHAGIQYALWHAVVSCGGDAVLQMDSSNLLQSVQQTTLVDCTSKDPIILGASLPIWNAIVSAYTALSIGYMTWVKSR